MQFNNDFHNENIKYINNRTFNYMMMCVEIAKKSDMRCKHGCIVVDKNGKIISEAHNKRNGLLDFVNKYDITKSNNKDDIKIVRFKNTNIQRHPIITTILDIYKS